ncbi:hypothetical protein ACW5WN_07640 [Aeromonas lacus]|uniref:hypothetical protein n=1 Tax=Aeromonas lacus TaxID=558884 RepID=UPI00051C8432|nr:hypothetical protein [Aeromonas lacus]
MKIKFNNKDYSIRQNADGLYSLTDVNKAWELEFGIKNELPLWRHDFLTGVYNKKYGHKVTNKGGKKGEVWGCAGALRRFNKHCLDTKNKQMNNP